MSTIMCGPRLRATLRGGATSMFYGGLGGQDNISLLRSGASKGVDVRFCGRSDYDRRIGTLFSNVAIPNGRNFQVQIVSGPSNDKHVIILKGSRHNRFCKVTQLLGGTVMGGNDVRVPSRLSDLDVAPRCPLQKRRLNCQSGGGACNT